MSYKDVFFKEVRQLFEKETAAYRRREKAESFMIEFFGDLMEELYDESESSSDRFEVEYERVRLFNRELLLKLNSTSIEVCVKDVRTNEQVLLDRIEDNGSTYWSRKHDCELNEELLECYLKEAFAGALKDHAGS